MTSITIHGNLPDTRPLPGAWTLGFMLSANRTERFLQWLVEEAIIPEFLKEHR